MWVGGAIFAVNSTMTIHNSLFEYNSAEFGGAVFTKQSRVTITDTAFINNYVRGIQQLVCSENDESVNCWDLTFAGALFHITSNITMINCQLKNSKAEYGGAIALIESQLRIETSTIISNTAKRGGGVMYIFASNFTITLCTVCGNHALSGGVFYLPDIHENDIIEVLGNKFYSNSAEHHGGVLFYQRINDHKNKYENILEVVLNHFFRNHAKLGGVLFIESIAIIVRQCLFSLNSAIVGVLYIDTGVLGLFKNTFTENNASLGAVVHARDSSLNNSFDNFTSNKANNSGTIYLNHCGSVRYFNVLFMENTGSVIIIDSNITMVNATFVSNRHVMQGGFQKGEAISLPPNSFTLAEISRLNFNIKVGGAISLFQGTLYFEGISRFENNSAENGGAINSAGSKIYVNEQVIIAYNKAYNSGGGIYLSYSSEIQCKGNCHIALRNNTAGRTGGGIHLVSSHIDIMEVHFVSLRSIPEYRSMMHFYGNKAERGGGISFEASAALNIKEESCGAYESIIFSKNTADYGGALYVDDHTISGTCSQKVSCFFQSTVVDIGNKCKAHSLHPDFNFSQNYAVYSGTDLYGGLLDRCTISTFAKVSGHISYSNYNGLNYFMNLVYNTSILISSDPVKVCLCTNDISYNCNHQTPLIDAIKVIKKGEIFSVPVVAVDQVRNPVSSFIQSSLKFPESGLAEGQLIQIVSSKCINLSFSVTSPHDHEELTLYSLTGPCKDANYSKVMLKVKFLPCECPIGFHTTGMNQTNCTCKCHDSISPFVACNIQSKSFIKMYKSNVWISYDNKTSGYLIYPNCPYGYCKPLNTTEINLNNPDGADEQCDLGRRSLLCGSCQLGLSLSLGSSLCLACPKHWPVLLIIISVASILSGFIFVTLILLLNITVAVGTINSLIFFVNILAANHSVFFPHSKSNDVLVVLVSWMNLELGIDTCFFQGMDAYSKSWVQLAYPSYVILLVVLIIVVSSYSSKFSRFIGKKDPVATLATLILFSYTKLLEIVFEALSFGTLIYPNGDKVILWLPDASVKFLIGKHIVLFSVALLILVAGTFYTLLVFSWQWLLHLPDWRVFVWIRNPRIQTFVETYHIPYIAKYRYWTGLLLIIRAILYLVSATDVSNDPQIVLISIIITIGGLLLLKQKLYKKMAIDFMETFIFFNLLLVSVVTWFSLGHSNSHWTKSVSYTAIALAFVLLTFVIAYHVYEYTPLCSMLQGDRIKKLFAPLTIFRSSQEPRRLLYGILQQQREIEKPVEPTFSVVEIQEPLLL